MKITKELLREVIEEEVRKVLKEERTPRDELFDLWGQIMNLIMSPESWNRAGGTPKCRADAHRLLHPILSKMQNAIAKIPK